MSALFCNILQPYRVQYITVKYILKGSVIKRIRSDTNISDVQKELLDCIKLDGFFTPTAKPVVASRSYLNYFYQIKQNKTQNSLYKLILMEKNTTILCFFNEQLFINSCVKIYTKKPQVNFYSHIYSINKLFSHSQYLLKFHKKKKNNSAITPNSDSLIIQQESN